MTPQDLLDAQCARLAQLDRDLPNQYPLPPGDPIMTCLPDGAAVAGIITHTVNPPGSLRRLWSASETWELAPLIGDRPHLGMDALLRQWREQLDTSEPDSACMVTWPSRDAHATRALLDHGFVPLSCLAVRPPAPPEPPRPGETVRVRQAGPKDLDAVVRLMLTELEYAALVGASLVRPDAAELKRTTAAARLHSDDPVWLAERDGVAIGLAECGWIGSGHPYCGSRLHAGPWGYVNCVSVQADARGTGVGGQLIYSAHQEFAQAEVLGSFLHYNPANALSSVFWHRHGYRPLWTIWEVRPAGALR
jgi:GNAT superfamily N-acetyltransferase